MKKISEQARSTLKLIERSPDTGEGWRSVSISLRPNMVTWQRGAADLYEFDGERIRFTDEGLIVMKYL